MRLLCAFLCLLYLPLHAQQPFLRNIWLSENRVPVKVNVLARDQQGYIIAGTDKGLFRYNGSVSKEIAGMVTDEVTALTLNGKQLWVGYKNGRLGRITGDSVKLVSYHNYKGTATVNGIQQANDGTLYCATENGLVVVRNDTATTYTTKDGLSDNFIYNITLLPNGHILAGTDLGINDIRFGNGAPEVSAISMQHGLPDNIVRVIRNNPGSDVYWIGTQQRGWGVVRYESP